MASKIKLVQGDTRPQPKFVVRDEETGEPMNLSGATVRLLFRALGSDALQAQVVGTLLTGLEDEDGNISLASPYNTPGAGGRVSFQWGYGDLDCEQGPYEGEIKISFSDGTQQTVYELLKFQVRDAVGP